MNADRARKLAVEAARGADRAEVLLVPAHGRLWWTGSALGNHRAMSQRGLRLVGGEVPPVRRPGRAFGGLYFRCNLLIYLAVKLTQFVKTPNVLNKFR
jgi:hypothetical protein